MTWQIRASCHGLNPETFFPSDSEEQGAANYLSAHICGHCPVRTDCLDEALRTNSVGVWAGTTLANRTSMKRRESYLRHR